MTQQFTSPNLQYSLFCTDVVDHPNGGISIMGVLDGADVRGTVKKGQPIPRKMFPLKLVLGINAPPGHHQVSLGIRRPSGGIMTKLDLEGFHIGHGETVHRCVANLDMEVDEDGLYTFEVILNGQEIGWSVLNMSFVVEFVD